MSFGSIGSQATQASASSQQLLLPANESQYENPDEQTSSSILLQNVIYPSETAFEQNETSSESSDDTVVELTDSERNNMGNRQCTSKEQSSKSEEKEDEGDIWVKRNDKTSKLSKREEKRKKKKQKNKDKTLNQNNGPGSSKLTTTGNGQEHCLSKNHGVVEVKEVDKWAEVKMADDYSSSSTGYHTPEVKTPKLGRTEKISETKNNNKCEKKSDATKPELPKRPKMEFSKNENSTQQELGKNGSITQQSSTSSNTHAHVMQEQLTSQFSSQLTSKSKPQQNSKSPSELALKSKPQQIAKTSSELASKSNPQPNSKPPQSSKPLSEPNETISKTEALAKLDSLTNSPRSQRRHALLLSNEVAKYIPLPPEKDRQTTMTIEESPVVYSKIMREPVSSEKIVKCASAVEHQTTPKIQPMTKSEFKNTTSADAFMELEKVNKKESTKINAVGKENEVKIVEPTSNNNAKQEMRASAIEIMEDNRANELREATTETIESVPGPGVAVLACIPPPEKALITHVPPPSPSSIAIFEEDEEGVFEIDESENRKSREMEVFNDNVCQRLSLLLETKELMEEKVDDSADSINDVDNVLLSEKSNDSYCSDGSEGNSSDDEYDENDYVQGSDSFDYSDDDEIDDTCDFGMDIPAKPQNKSDSKLSIARTPGGKNDASPLDMMNNNFKMEEMKQGSHPPCKTLVEHGDDEIDISKQVIKDTLKPSVEVSGHLEASKHLDDSSGYSEQCEMVNRHEMSETPKQVTGKSDHNVMLSPSPSTKDKHSASLPTSEVTSSNIQPGWGSGRYDSDSFCVASGGSNDRRKGYDIVDKDYSYDSSNSPKRSRLDESIKALFKMPKMEEFTESEYAQNIHDLDFDMTPSSDKNTIIEDIIIPEDVIDTQASVRRRSFGFTESSDLDVSEQRDDVSTDSMLADDEDEGEVLFSRTYPEPSGAEVLISCTVVNSAVQSGNNDKFWDDEDLDDDFDLDDDDDEEQEEDQEPENEHYPQDLFASDAYVDINDSDFDNARKQMQDIHEHLKNLKHQMNNLHDDLGAASRVPEAPVDVDEEPVSKRRAMTD